MKTIIIHVLGGHMITMLAMVECKGYSIITVPLPARCLAIPTIKATVQCSQHTGMPWHGTVASLLATASAVH